MGLRGERAGTGQGGVLWWDVMVRLPVHAVEGRLEECGACTRWVGVEVVVNGGDQLVLELGAQALSRRPWMQEK